MVSIWTMQMQCSVEYALQKPHCDFSSGPLLIALHGWGQTCTEFINDFTPLADRGIAVAAPQAPHPFYVKPSEKKVGFSWLTSHRRDEAVADLVEYLDTLRSRMEKELPHAVDQVYVLGFSQGASIAYRYALLTERTVAGVVSCASDLPPDVKVRLDVAVPERVLLVHGESDQLVPVAVMESARASLETAGVPVAVRTFRSGHRITPDAVNAIGDWVLSGS